MRSFALGGGAFSSGGNRDVIQNSGLVVYLTCPVREIMRRIKDKGDRPSFEGEKDGRSDLEAKP